jgi:hypothetical protein
MLAFPDVIHLFAYEFSSLRTGRLTLARILTGSFYSLLFGHHYLHCELVFCAIRRCSSRVGKVFEANCLDIRVFRTLRLPPELRYVLLVVLDHCAHVGFVERIARQTPIPETAAPNQKISALFRIMNPLPGKLRPNG